VRAVEIEDRVTVATPEGVDLDVVVAGLGSRFMSSAVDTTVQVLIIGTSFLVGSVLETGALAIAVVGAFAGMFVYPTVFDAFAGGRTPGRALAGLRLVTTEGATVGFVAAVVRNVVRIIDFLPALYSIGVVAVLATDRNQRLGDLAAGTIVVRRELRRADIVVPGASRARSTEASAVDGPVTAGWDLTGLSSDDVAVLRSFLARRSDLDPTARQRLASELARRLEPLVVGPDRRQGDEVFLEQVLAGRDRHGR
jgi:uncharacterized RDD family membrane protein YckC